MVLKGKPKKTRKIRLFAENSSKNHQKQVHLTYKFENNSQFAKYTQNIAVEQNIHCIGSAAIALIDHLIMIVANHDRLIIRL